ncbi:MAG: 50S ribosomal protein L9 [Gammaproteobacteria bacterium]|nr:50S ribosomal protein L9 [Gammaproteobacteria bacterium]
MNVILLERIGKLGTLGDEVSVKNGYARNYLIPTGRAVRVTSENRAAFEARRAELEAAAGEKLAAAETRAASLEGVSATLMVRASEEGRLFGSVGTVEISRALTNQGNEVSKAEVSLPEGTIRQVGEYEVEIQLHPGVTATVGINVVAE